VPKFRAPKGSGLAPVPGSDDGISIEDLLKDEVVKQEMLGRTWRVFSSAYMCWIHWIREICRRSIRSIRDVRARKAAEELMNVPKAPRVGAFGHCM